MASADIEIAETSSKGQLTIPKDVREALDVEEGTKFAVYGGSDTIVLKKLSLPSKKDFEELADWGEKHAEEKGITEEEVLEDD